MRSLTLIVCLAAAFWAAGTGASRAEFRVCNSSAADVRVAFGNHDARYGWTSRGWWTVPAGVCQGVLYGDVARGNYYVYMTDSANRAIAVPENQTGGTFCVKDTAFDLRTSAFMTPNSTIACESYGLKSIKFRAVEVNEAAPDFSYTLPSETVATPTPNSAGLTAVAPVIQGTAQNLPRPAPPPVVAPAPQPASVAPPTVQPQPQAQRPPQASAAGTACQRYPNLC